MTDWDNELVCYKELSEDLTNKIQKLFKRNTSSPSITIERKNLYIERFASVWIAVNYAHDTCAKGKNISVLPSKAGKCLSPSNINAYQITNQLIIKWDLPTADTPYELRYREALTESAPWTLVAQSENILGYFVNVERIPNSCSHPPNHISLKDRKILVNLSMAYYRVNISAYNEAGESPRAIYIVPEFSATDNFQPYKLYKIMVHASDTNWKPISRSLLQTLSDNDTTSLVVIEHESKAPLKLDLFTDGGEDSKHDTCQSEKPSDNTDMSPRHEEISAEAVTSEEDIISTEVQLLSDYASVEFSQKALMSLAVSIPERTAHPRLEMELSSKPAQTVHKVLFASQDYLKQSQVVLLPSGTNFMGQAS
ncbi:hypothetical protein IHE44_0011512 [Lamprotornis superbus]|uniref:Fibronectin type-III domain-containing protein n=1 Tax=Lamprotornis superbus TaxID=245042 RepID=A0A835TSG2_9PASS|nr:hypothetical protein IHE44_0011512 [Lamprotornis superbus]